MDTSIKLQHVKLLRYSTEVFRNWALVVVRAAALAAGGGAGDATRGAAAARRRGGALPCPLRWRRVEASQSDWDSEKPCGPSVGHVSKAPAVSSV